MCAVSAITPVIQQQYPPLNQWAYQDLTGMKAVLDRLDALDKKLGAIQCENDAPKTAFLKELSDRIAALETATKGG